MALKALCPTPPPWLALPGCSCLKAFALAGAAPEDSSLSSPQGSLVLLMFQVSAQTGLMGRLPQLPSDQCPSLLFTLPFTVCLPHLHSYHLSPCVWPFSPTRL